MAKLDNVVDYFEKLFDTVTARLIVGGNNTPYNITAKASTIAIKAAPGYLKNLVVNASGFTDDAITIYNHATGATSPIAGIATPQMGGSYEFDAEMTVGITVVTAGASAKDYTINYK